MAAGVLQAPGTVFGPCLEVCAHVDCASTRKMAKHVCRFCSKVIGYDRAFYGDPDSSHGDLVHAVCLEETVK